MKTVETFCANFPPQSFSNWTNKVYAYKVPIELREYVLKLFRDEGIPVKLRYRGSRTKSVGRVMKRKPDMYRPSPTYIRSREQANQDCLLQDAKFFTIYGRTY